MNKMRRKAIYVLIKRLSFIKEKLQSDETFDELDSELEDIYDEVDYLRDEEECYMDNMPENLQNSSRYEAAEKACNKLYDAADNIEEAKDYTNDKDALIKYIDNAVTCLKDAVM